MFNYTVNLSKLTLGDVSINFNRYFIIQFDNIGNVFFFLSIYIRKVFSYYIQLFFYFSYMQLKNRFVGHQIKYIQLL